MVENIENSDYLTSARGLIRYAKNDIAHGAYDKSVTHARTAIGDYLKLAANSPYSSARIKILREATDNLGEVLQSLNQKQKEARSFEGTNPAVSELIKAGSEISGLIRKINSTTGTLASKELLARRDYMRGKVIGIFSIIFLLSALASISTSLTGNVIGGSLENNNWVSIGLFFLGCAMTFFYFKAKNRITEKKKK